MVSMITVAVVLLIGGYFAIQALLQDARMKHRHS